MTQEIERILVTNDDGIDAPGIQVAIELAQQVAKEVWVSAPASDCSGMSRQVSLHEPLRVVRRGDRQIAVTGSPVDSVMIGLRHLMLDNPPDLVISGVNSGANTAQEVGYSGTVGAALTARMLGVRSIALSQAWRTRKDLPWETSRAWLPKVIERLWNIPTWPEQSIWNVNVPSVEPDAVTGVEMTRLGTRLRLDVMVDKRVDHRENEYFWLAFQRDEPQDVANSDVAALERNAVSVTPIGLDLTHHTLVDELHGHLQG